MNKLRIIFYSIVIGIFAGTVASFAFTGPNVAPPQGTQGFWSINSGNMYYSGGNVGVGTSSPTIGKLSVNGVGVAGGFNQNWNISTILDLDASANSTNEAIRMLSYSSTAAWGIIAGATNGGLYFATSSINGSGTPGVVLAMLNNGNVGIGTTSPGQKLSVAGTIESTSGGIKFPDGITKASGSLDAAGMVRSDGGAGSGNNVNMLTLTLDLTGKTGKWIHVFGGTAIVEDANTADASIVRLIIDNNAGSSATISAQRQGMGVNGTYIINQMAALSTQGYFKITSAYAVSNVTIKLNGGINYGAFHYGKQVDYTYYDGENAGASLGYAIF